ncbi:DUF1642 domain-containing protein [Listeria booriae]|uniref:DUF1642 domain-containing protein n=1 Tax=Listeria booriae TaxID=1552123 RepID=UPI0016290928|nr:DUF1642 domain-containing protein [Listeria booriae]MBC2077658.1 DUF1642 domain-containing protein [Listeria booriae]
MEIGQKVKYTGTEFKDILKGTYTIVDIKNLFATVRIKNENGGIYVPMQDVEIVRDEPLYYVKMPHSTWDDERSELVTNTVYLQHNITSGEIFISRSAKSSGDFKSELSEETIKSIEERYWHFAVPIEEGEG